MLSLLYLKAIRIDSTDKWHIYIQDKMNECIQSHTSLFIHLNHSAPGGVRTYANFRSNNLVEGLGMALFCPRNDADGWKCYVDQLVNAYKLFCESVK